MKMSNITPIYVDSFPKPLEPGNLYISKKFKTAAHLCCCGCGNKVITPLKPQKWALTEKNGQVSLYPSIGNWSFACQSHYWITKNAIDWSWPMSESKIAAVRAQDQRDLEAHYQERTQQTVFAKIWNQLKSWFR